MGIIVRQRLQPATLSLFLSQNQLFYMANEFPKSQEDSWAKQDKWAEGNMDKSFLVVDYREKSREAQAREKEL